MDLEVRPSAELGTDSHPLADATVKLALTGCRYRGHRARLLAGSRRPSPEILTGQLRARPALSQTASLP